VIRSFYAFAAAAVCCLASADSLPAVQPSETLLPATTKGYISVQDVDALRERLSETDLGRLAEDPVMQPFMDDLKKQLREKLALAGDELGITWEDLESVYGGETAAALVQPKGDKSQHAFIVLCDVTGHLAEAKALLDKISARLREQGATMRSQTAHGVPILIFTLPKKENETAARQAVFAIAESQLLASDSVQEAVDLLGRFGGQPQGTLQQVPAYRAAMERVAQASGQAAPHLRWFAEPFGLAEVVRAADAGAARRGVDYLKIFRNQGFAAVQGLGGYVQVKTDGCEFLHHSFAYVPSQTPGAQALTAADFKLAARMLQFPNGRLETPSWLPRELATAATFNWKMQDAFNYAETLVNEIAGDPIYEDVIDSFKTDPYGPRIDLRKDLIAHLGERISIASDYRLPITPESERLMVAIELTDPAAVAATINKAMSRDPDVRKIPFGEHIIWEILDPAAAEGGAAAPVKVDGPFGPFGGNLQDDEDEEEDKPAFPNSAVTVAYGRLIWTSHVDFAKDLLTTPAPGETLVASADYQAIMAALERLGAGEDSFLYFSRADEALRPTYELVRQGKMPEAKTLLGRFLNQLFAEEEDELLRQQEIDASTLPDYQVVRRHLGPGGAYVRTEANGWLAVGCGLSKRAEAE
jgi:hypothetical protein